MSIVMKPAAMNKEKAYKRLIKRNVIRSYSDSAAITNGDINNPEARLHRPMSLGTNSSDSRKNDRAPSSARPALRHGISLQDFADRALDRPTTGIIMKTSTADDQFPPIHDRRSQYITLVPTKLQNPQQPSSALNGAKDGTKPDAKPNGNMFPSASSIRKLFAADYHKKASAKQHVKFNSDNSGIIKNSENTPDMQMDINKNAKFYRLRTPKRNSVKQVSFTDGYVIEDSKPSSDKVQFHTPTISTGDSYALTERNLEIHASFLVPKHKIIKTSENNVTTKQLDERVLKWVEERNFSVKLSCHDIPEMDENISISDRQGPHHVNMPETRDLNLNVLTNKPSIAKKFLKDNHSDHNIKISDSSSTGDDVDVT